MLFSSTFGAGLFAVGVAAHGAVTSYKIAGKDYPGWVNSLISIRPQVANARIQLPRLLPRQLPERDPMAMARLQPNLVLLGRQAPLQRRHLSQTQRFSEPRR